MDHAFLSEKFSDIHGGRKCTQKGNYKCPKNLKDLCNFNCWVLFLSGCNVSELSLFYVILSAQLR
jgi:hypothetical protein